jgi:hypothetical protein
MNSHLPSVDAAIPLPPDSAVPGTSLKPFPGCHKYTMPLISPAMMRWRTANVRGLQRTLDRFSRPAPAISVRLRFELDAVDELRRHRTKLRAAFAHCRQYRNQSNRRGNRQFAGRGRTQGRFLLRYGPFARQCSEGA